MSRNFGGSSNSNESWRSRGTRAEAGGGGAGWGGNSLRGSAEGRGRGDHISGTNPDRRRDYCFKCDTFGHRHDSCWLKHTPICRKGMRCPQRRKCPKNHGGFIDQHWAPEFLQELVDTEKGTQHFVDFACVVCGLRLVRAVGMMKILKNCVWANSTVEGAISVDPPERQTFNIHKGVYTRPVRCSGCWNRLGYMIPEDGRHKLYYIPARTGENQMVVLPPNEREPDPSLLSDLLAKHTPLALGPGKPYPRFGLRDTNGQLNIPRTTEQQLLKSVGEEESQENIALVSKLLSTNAVREQVTMNALQQRIEKLQREKKQLEQENRRSLEPVIFQLATLLEATEEFSVQRLVGRGGFGPVYRAEINIRGQKQEAAVKLWDNSGTQTKEEFLQELSVLSNAQHPHLIPLLGHCVGTYNNKPLLALVYPYMKEGSLQDLLSTQERRQRLDWRQRVTIATELADCIAYLHSLQPRVLHRDVKSANILLDGECKVFLADLGLARTPDITLDRLDVSRNQVGTPGYIDPEYSDSGLYSASSDIYSLGVILLELFTGEPPQDRKKAPAGLAARARKYNVKADLLAGWPAKSGEHFFSLAVSCVASDVTERPTARNLLIQLQELKNEPQQGQKKERECIICEDSAPQGRFLPCFHSITCFACSEMITKCPICDTPIDKFEGGYFPATFN